MAVDTPAERLEIAFQLYELAEDMVRAKALRGQPDATEEQLAAAVRSWREKGDTSLEALPEFRRVERTWL